MAFLGMGLARMVPVVAKLSPRAAEGLKGFDSKALLERCKAHGNGLMAGMKGDKASFSEYHRDHLASPLMKASERSSALGGTVDRANSAASTISRVAGHFSAGSKTAGDVRDLAEAFSGNAANFTHVLGIVAKRLEGWGAYSSHLPQASHTSDNVG
jgi:hypothetical protein